MLSALAKAAAVLAAFALSGALAGAAAAQGYQAVPSPLKVEADPNGVNVATGKMTLDTPVLSVPAAPNLRFDRVQNAAPLVKGRVLKNAPDSTASSSFSVHTGKGASEAFECVEIDCGSVTASGSTLRIGMARNGPITYREAGTGAVYYFNLVHVDTYGSADRSILHYVSSIAYPNGETLSYGYETATLPGDTFGRLFYRPVRIDSNLGYYITIGYKPGALGEPGWNAVAEATLYAAADPATPLGRLTYGEGTVTDLAGRVYSCCGSSLGANVEVSSGSLQLPGEGAPALQAASHPTVPDVIGSVIRDGVSYSYSYTNLRFVGQAQGYLFDKVTVDGPNGYHQVYDIAQRQYQNVLAKITDPLGRATAVTSDAAGRTTGVAAPEGNSAQVGYDQWGNIIAKTTSPKPGSGLAATTETAAYPADTCTGVACYRPTYVRDALGRQTDFVYDAGGQIVEQTDPPDAAGVRRKTYIAYAGTPSRRSVVRICGDTTTCGTPNELRTEYDYWGSTYLPSVERRIDAARGITLTTTYAYDPAGRPLAVDGPLAGTDDAVYFRYDIVGRKIWEIGARDSNGLRAAKHFYYRDSDDKAVAVEEGTLPDASSSALTILTRSDIAYDGHRNPVRETVSAAGAVQSVLDKSWDDRGRLVCQAQRMNPAAFGEQPGACAFTTQGSQGPDRIARNGYDAASQLLTLEKGVGTALQQVYARYEYTPNGKQKAVTDANGNRAEMTWDGLDRQRRWIFPSNTPGSANPADYEEYGYDAVGNRTSLRKRDGATLTYQYDNLNRVTLKTVPASASGAAGYSVHYGYDVAGLQTYARFGSPSGPGVASAYDGFGRLVTATTTMDGTARSFTSAYDAAGNRIGLTGSDGSYTGWAWDAAGHATAVQEGSGVALQLFYDSAGRRSRTNDLSVYGSQATYGYDALGRLTSLNHDLAGTSADQVFTFAYNAASQVVTRTSSNDSYASNTAYAVTRSYSVNGLNQYTAAGPATFAYDANGNLTSDGATSFVYDAENRLVSASGARNATLSYDPLGRLWQVSSAATGTTRFVYDGDRLIEEHDGAGTLLRYYRHGPGADEPLMWLENGWDRRFLHADHQGSIVAVADNYGNPVTINAYDSWGIPNAANVGRFGYTGQAWLPELGMYYYKARIYSPTLGRFLQTDPTGYDDQVNLYAYVSNDPANQRDSEGTTSAGCGTRIEGQSTSGCLSYSSASGEDGSRGARLTLAAYQPPEEENARRGFLGIEADPLAETRLEQFSRAHDQIRQLEPNNPQLSYISTRDYVPTWSQVKTAQQEAAEVQNRARVIDYARAHGGAAQPGYRGGGNYSNDGRGGSMVLPGRGVTYKEYDVRPYQPGVNRGRERIVIDSRGRVYYTGDHYLMFRRIR